MSGVASGMSTLKGLGAAVAPAEQASSGRVFAVIPAFNEEDRIAATVGAVRALPGVRDIIVVSDGSTDHTGERARTAGAHVIEQSRNQGKARAMETGADAVARLAARSAPEQATANRRELPLLLFLDADLGHTAREASVLLDPVLRDEADVTIATFPIVPGRGGGRGVVVRLSRWGIRRATGQTMIAPLSGQRCLTLPAFVAARPLAHGFGVETAMTIDVLRAGYRVLEVPTQMDHRVTGNDWRAQRHRLRQLRDVLRALVPRLLPGRRKDRRTHP